MKDNSKVLIMIMLLGIFLTVLMGIKNANATVTGFNTQIMIVR